MLVCRQWRDICLLTPELWSRISISPNEPDSLEKARRRLLRSKVVPLDIFLDFSSRSSFSAQASQIQHTSLQLLRPTIHRWRTFMLLVPYRPQATAALALCSSPAPLLESFTIQVSNPMLNASSLDWGASGRPSCLPFRGMTPRLRICSLTSFWCEHQPAYFVRDLPYSRMVFPGVGPCLTKLRLVGFWNDFAPDIHETMLVLRQCPLLEELYIRNMSDVDSIPDDMYGYTVGEVSLLHLKRLSFYYSGVSRTCALLHRVHMPVLRHLELSFLDNITPCLKHLKETHAEAPIHTLRIEASLFNELKLMRLLRYLKDLAHLELVDVEDVSCNLLKGMSAPLQPNEWILPSLTTLNLEGCTSVEWDDLKTLVESRLPSSSASSAAKFSSADSSGFSTASKLAYASYRASSATTSSSASQYARLDLTRCSQISRERIQWLRMYVGEVVVREEPGR
ncbi:hypothetical protein BU17DRAFT_58517 [Hysterangium stoloniferum]|nr:hypothetical protein BU17DRAFT_58517 [Hysterangium stoloniferum]